ncbi:MAG: cellulase family glycosylhydrolase [Armatimonadota bacterium]
MPGDDRQRSLTRREFLRSVAAGAAALSAAPAVRAAAVERSSEMDRHNQQSADGVPRYGRWHGEFDRQTRADRVVFVGPDGAEQTRPTFLHQPAELTYDDHGYESLSPRGEPVLAARFTPTEVGRYRCRALAGDGVVAESEFRCEASDHPGYVQRSARDPRYFAFTNGDCYCAIGLNLCAPGWGSRNQLLGLGDYRRWLRQLSDNGGNFARLWVSTPYFNAQAEVAGQLDAAVFARLDAVIESARQHGVRLKLCLENFRSLDPSLSSQHLALKHPDDGRPPADMDEWFLSDVWQQLWWKRVDAYLARYADDPTVIAWELWNEINCCVTSDWSVQRDWTRRVLPMVKAKSPRNLVVNSIGSFDDERYQSWYDDFKMDEMEFQQVHRYLDQGAPWSICHFDAPAFSKDAVERARRPDRPVLLAETGAVNDGHSGPFRYYRADHRGIIFHDTTYPAFFAGAAGTGHIWHWDNYVDSKNLWDAYCPFADLVAGVKLDEEGFRPLDLSCQRFWAFALLGKQHLLLWLRNRADSWYRVLRDDQEPEALRHQHLGLGALGVQGGSITTIFPWRENTGQATLSGGDLQLPPFRYGVLLRIRR